MIRGTRAPAAGRAALVVVAALALPVALVWWFGSALLAGDHSACSDSPLADLAHGSSYAGGVLACAALAAGADGGRGPVQVGWALLLVYATLLGLAVLAFFVCG